MSFERVSLREFVGIFLEPAIVQLGAVKQLSHLPRLLPEYDKGYAAYHLRDYPSTRGLPVRRIIASAYIFQSVTGTSVAQSAVQCMIMHS